MAKTLQSFQECGSLIEASEHVAFTCHPEVRVAVFKIPFPSQEVKCTMYVSLNDTALGIAEVVYPSVDAFVEAFQINDIDEVFEVLD